MGDYVVSSAEAWKDALECLYGDSTVFVATGPRSDHEWGHDVNAMFDRSVRDPRGWLTVDNLSAARRAGRAARYPFEAFEERVLQDSLEEICPKTAEQLLVALASGWGKVSELRSVQHGIVQLAASAKVLLSRFGSPPVCWTNVEDATYSPGLEDFGVSEWSAFTPFAIDHGLVVISETEVGVFWSFNPI